MLNEQNSSDNSNHRNTLREQDLQQFTGTEVWHRHPLFRRYLYTDGVQYVAEQGGAHWLIDKIFAEQYENINLPEQEFQVWILELLETGGANLTCHDGDYNWQHEEKINFTDFPLKKITLYFTGGVLLLPSEY